jgi:hypothetical protein
MGNGFTDYCFLWFYQMFLPPNLERRISDISEKSITETEWLQIKTKSKSSLKKRRLQSHRTKGQEEK